MSKNKGRAVAAMRIAGGIVGAGFAALGILTALVEFNPTLILFGFFLIYGALFRVGDAMIVHLAGNGIFWKNYRAGVEKRPFAISADAPLSALVRQLRRDSVTAFEIVGESGDPLFELDEDDVGVMCAECELSEPIGEAFEKVYSK